MSPTSSLLDQTGALESPQRRSCLIGQLDRARHALLAERDMRAQVPTPGRHLGGPAGGRVAGEETTLGTTILATVLCERRVLSCLHMARAAVAAER
jgi:hypothetical protein